MTEGLNKNRLAITSGFDKMDEVKKWDLQQLPGFEATLDAVEEPEKKDEGEEDIEDIIQKLNKRIENKIVNMEKLNISAKKANKEENFELAQYYLVKIKEEKDSIEEIQNEINRLQQTLEEESVEKPKITTVRYEKGEMDKCLNNKESIDLLNFYGLKLPSEYKDKSLEELQKAFEKGMEETANLKKSIKNVAEYKKDTLTGLILAFPIKGQQAKDKSKELIKEYNIMQIFINNMGQLRNYKKITGTGIIHFNNPQQLVNRLELLAGSIFAGNNGVKQEFSQIAHLLHQLKVITKKTLNDLLKKYILFK